MTTASWFEVDREGLAKLVARRGKAFVLHELLANAWDTKAKSVNVNLFPVEGRPLVNILVEDDDPDGFKNLTHAWTLFAESEKKVDPEKRGRFNLGEKLVLALCEEAMILSTTGGVRFGRDGRHAVRDRRAWGSSFAATLRMTREEYQGVCEAARFVLPPEGIKTSFNGEPVRYRKPLATFRCTLPTEIADAEGFLRRTSRQTVVEVHETLQGETATIFELGVPVVATGDKYHSNVLQKVPLNSDRDNVTPAYLAELRAQILNHTYHLLRKEDAAAIWIRDAAGNEETSKEAVEKVITLRYGEKRVIADPSDPEGTMRAVSEGYTVIQPGSLSKDEWRNVKRDAVALPAGQVTPSAKPYSPDGEALDFVPPEKWTDGIRRVVAYAEDLAKALLGHPIDVQVAREVTWPYGATYGGRELVFNLGRLGHRWFDGGPREAVDKLLLHEFAHEGGIHHLQEEYHDAICALGAKLAALALKDPGFFKKHGR